MLHQYLKPSEPLNHYIINYLIIHLKFDNGFIPPPKPYPVCPEQVIFFYIKGNVKISQHGKIITSIPKICIGGQQTERHDKIISSEFLMIQVLFHPGALNKLFGISMLEFLGNYIDAEGVLGNEMKSLNEILQNSPSYSDMITIIETYFLKKIQKVKSGTRAVDFAGRIILENPQNFTLETLAKQSYLSTKQFERIFLNQLGVTPKFFARICRFYKAFELKEKNPSTDWLSIAWDCGYTDYQHLSKDFKQFSGQTPNSLILENSLSPERLLGIKNMVK